MLSVPIPPNEAERQEALDRMELLDTPADPYLDALTRLARDLFQVKMALVSLVDRDRQWFKSRQGLDAAETPRSLSYCSQAVLRNEPLIVEDSQADVRFARTELARNTPDVRFYAGWPLHNADGLPLGTLCLADPKPRAFGKQDIFKLRDLAYLAEHYLHLQHCSQQASDLRDALSREQRKGMLDALTQLWNRAGLLHFLPLEQAAAERHQLRLGLIYCDLDHFKQVNDHYGHLAGDACLRHAAQRIQQRLRSSDLLARFGGEEFVALLVGTDLTGALDLAEQLREDIARTPCSYQQQSIPLSLSIGLHAGVPNDPNCGERWLELADRALYRAKADGRNRVVSYEAVALNDA
ncbi:MAG TPA: GGDEF domain-containing protein [Pseudomonas sp.]|nr:GGDEF domain-containing protein [Pseudomonas sp.]